MKSNTIIDDDITKEIIEKKSIDDVNNCLEIDKLKQAGAITAGLGPRILRTETAGMIAAALVLYEYDQM